MVAEARGRISVRKDRKYFLYLPKHLVEDTSFPFKLDTSTPVKVIIDMQNKRLLIHPLRQRLDARRRK